MSIAFDLKYRGLFEVSLHSYEDSERVSMERLARGNLVRPVYATI